MNVRKDLPVLVILMAAVAAPAAGQTAAPAAATSTAPNAASIPDFSGAWAHPGIGFGLPLSGPGPVRNKSRLPSGAEQSRSAGRRLQQSDSQARGRGGASRSSARSRCRAWLFRTRTASACRIPCPISSGTSTVRLLQQPDKVTLVYQHDDDFRQVRLNQPHPANVIPSVHGDSVGHYEGDTLVIDTVGVRVGPYRTIDRFGTPYTPALHVVERYRLIDYEATKAGLDRTRGRNGRRLAARSIPTTGARACSSNSRWRTKASSPCPGRRRSPTAATPIHGRNVSAPRTCSTSMMDTSFPTPTRICRPPTSRTSEVAWCTSRRVD